ncbi:MAG: glycogen/starch synthase [Muribaculum sp.]|nr:glycogen/starch synthase [Muribaculum sp.]
MSVKPKFLFVTQEITPYIPSSDLSNFGKALPQAIHQKGYEVRIFMPKYGIVNERRNQLHEVIRLSGVNIIIDDNDHPLIIKVASLQPARLQVYFIDNDDYFQKSASDVDPIGSNRADNDERDIFFTHGTLETAKKLRWDPVVIHCAGRAAAISPMYMRNVYADESAFKDAKIVYSILPDQNTPAPLDSEFFSKLIADGVPQEIFAEFEDLKSHPNLLHFMAIRFADGVIFNTPDQDPELLAYAEKLGKPVASAPLDNVEGEFYTDFYNSL